MNTSDLFLSPAYALLIIGSGLALTIWALARLVAAPRRPCSPVKALLTLFPAILSTLAIAAAYSRMGQLASGEEAVEFGDVIDTFMGAIRAGLFGMWGSLVPLFLLSRFTTRQGVTARSPPPPRSRAGRSNEWVPDE